MPLNRKNTRHFHRVLFGGIGQRVTLLKRDDDLRQGVVRAILLFQVRRSQITKTGETILGGEAVDMRCTWHIPLCELDRVGVPYLNALDRIVDEVGGTGTWMPQSDTMITSKMFGNHVDLECTIVHNPAV
jgi:hypothetical protein